MTDRPDAPADVDSSGDLDLSLLPELPDLVGLGDEISQRVGEIDICAVVIGRGSESDVRVSDPSVSRAHLRVVESGDVAVAVDLGSGNGSTVTRDDGVFELAPGTPVLLRPGDVVTTSYGVELYRFD